MNKFTYKSGIWNVEAQVREVGSNQRMAIISALAENGKSQARSMHTIVFDHLEGCDDMEEVKQVTQDVLINSH